MQTRGESRFGVMLRDWRRTRRMPQLELALEAGVSSRHLSFMETGRARPSQEMVLSLAEALDVPLRDRNTLLEAAGYAAAYQETGIGAPEIARVRRVLEFMLRQHEPYGAVVEDRHWNVLMANRPMTAMLTRLLGIECLPSNPPLNLMRLAFDPRGLRPHIANWEQAASELLARLRREAANTHNLRAQQLLGEVLAFPGVDILRRGPEPPHSFVIPIQFRTGPLRLNLFTAVTTLGTPQDVTLQEVRIETFFPADDETDRLLRGLFAGDCSH